MGVILDRVL